MVPHPCDSHDLTAGAPARQAVITMGLLWITRGYRPACGDRSALVWLRRLSPMPSGDLSGEKPWVDRVNIRGMRVISERVVKIFLHIKKMKMNRA